MKSELMSNFLKNYILKADFKNKDISLRTSHFSVWYQVKLLELYHSLMKLYKELKWSAKMYWSKLAQTK